MTSTAAAEFVKRFEGCRLTAYRDCAGVLTIGVGHTGGIREGQNISQEEADSFLQQDLRKAENAVGRLVQTPLTDNQLTALVDFVFNLGAGRLQASTLRRKINRGEAASGEFNKWVYAGGVKQLGLIRRREAEAQLFRS